MFSRLNTTNAALGPTGTEAAQGAPAPVSLRPVCPRSGPAESATRWHWGL